MEQLRLEPGTLAYITDGKLAASPLFDDPSLFEPRVGLCRIVHIKPPLNGHDVEQVVLESVQDPRRVYRCAAEYVDPISTEALQLVYKNRGARGCPSYVRAIVEKDFKLAPAYQ